MFEPAAAPAPAASCPRAAARLRAARGLTPGPAALTLLAGIDVAGLCEADRVDHLVAVEAQAAWLEVQRAAALVAVAGPVPRLDERPGVPSEQVDVEERSVHMEVACALRISTRAAAGRIAAARRLAGELAPAAAAMESGQWHGGHRWVACEELAGLTPSVVGVVLEAALRHASTDTPARLRRRLRTLVARCDAEAASRRVHEAKARRRADLTPEPDLQGRITLVGPWEQTAWVHRIADSWAREQHKRLRAAAAADPGLELPTLAALRADAYVEAMRLLAIRGATAATPGAAGAPRREAIVMVPLATVLGLADDPGVVPGYGPVPAPIARELLAGADHWGRFLLDDHARVVGTGSTRYRPSGRLRELVTATDPRCTLEPCERPSSLADLDHLERYDGTNTTSANLHPPCRTHHRVKTHGRWRVARGPDGAVTWTSPTGHAYRQHPEPEWDTGPPPAAA